MNKERLHIVDGQKEYYITLNEILFCSADGNYCDIYMTQKTIYKSIRIQLGQLWSKIEEMDQMAEHHLERIGRSYILNLRYIEFVNVRKGVVVLRSENDTVQINVAKAACKSLSEFVNRVYKPSNLENIGVNIPSRDFIRVDKNITKKYLEHEYVDLQLPSGKLWAVYDVDTSNEFGFYHSLFESPYLELINDYPKDQFEHYLDSEEDAVRAAWGGFWRLPTQEEWQELLNECELKWGITDNNEKVCEVLGRNGNKIILSSIIQSRGLCTYWAPLMRKDDIYEFLPHNYSIEIHEPYVDEPSFCFSSNFDGVSRKIHGIVSPEDLSKEWNGVPKIKAISERNRQEFEKFADF